MTTPPCRDCGTPASIEALASPGESFRPRLFLCERGKYATTLPYRRLTADDLIPDSTAAAVPPTATVGAEPNAGLDRHPGVGTPARVRRPTARLALG